MSVSLSSMYLNLSHKFTRHEHMDHDEKDYIVPKDWTLIGDVLSCHKKLINEIKMMIDNGGCQTKRQMGS